jgi:hypothetical protein
MSAFDLAWSVLKMPAYDTPVSNIKFLTGNREDYDNNDEILGGLYPEGDLSQIQQMTPNEYLNRTPTTSHPNLGGWYAEKIRQAIENNQKLRLGMPFVQFDPNITDAKDAEYRENPHDGRNRMAAMQKLGYGDTKFPVRVIHWPPKRRVKGRGIL